MTLLSDGFFWFYAEQYTNIYKSKKSLFPSVYIITFIELHKIIMLQNLCFETQNVSLITVNTDIFWWY